MKRKLFFFFLVFTLSAMQMLTAQENKLIILNLKTGYSVKGKIIEQTSLGVKIKTLNGEIFEYKADEVSNTADAKSASSSNKIFSSSKVIPLVVAKGDKFLNVGIGFLRQLPGGNSEKQMIPPIPISFEYIINDDLFGGKGALGFGGFIGYTAEKQNYYSEDFKTSRLIIGGRGYVHYGIVEKLDTYAGALLGYKNDVVKYTYGNSPEEKITDVKPNLNVFAGCRYFFSDKIAGMAELGWGISIITIGVTVKL